MKERKKFVVTSFSYPQEKDPIVHELSVIAARERKSSSEIIVDLVEAFVKAHSSGNDSFKLDNWQEDPEFQAVPTILAPTQKWYSYLNDCDKDDLTKIAISAKNILKQIEHYRKK